MIAFIGVFLLMIVFIGVADIHVTKRKPSKRILTFLTIFLVLGVSCIMVAMDTHQPPIDLESFAPH